jgi:hypothetical protein
MRRETADDREITSVEGRSRRARARRSTWEWSEAPKGPNGIPRKEVIQPHLPVRLPCYDFVPVAGPTFDGCLLAVGPPASGVTDSHDVTGGVYKAREHIHRGVLTRGY